MDNKDSLIDATTYPDLQDPDGAAVVFTAIGSDDPHLDEKAGRPKAKKKEKPFRFPKPRVDLKTLYAAKAIILNHEDPEIAKRNKNLLAWLEKLGPPEGLLDERGHLLNGSELHARAVARSDLYAIQIAGRKIARDNIETYAEILRGKHVIQLGIGDGQFFAEVCQMVDRETGARPQKIVLTDFVDFILPEAEATIRDALSNNVLLDELEDLDEPDALEHEFDPDDLIRQFASDIDDPALIENIAQIERAARAQQSNMPEFKLIAGDMMDDAFYETDMWQEARADPADTVVFIDSCFGNDLTRKQFINLMNNIRRAVKPGTQIVLGLDSSLDEETVEKEYNYAEVIQWLVASYVRNEWEKGNKIAPETVSAAVTVGWKNGELKVLPHIIITDPADLLYTDSLRKPPEATWKADLKAAQLEVCRIMHYDGAEPFEKTNINVWVTKTPTRPDNNNNETPSKKLAA